MSYPYKGMKVKKHELRRGVTSSIVPTLVVLPLAPVVVAEATPPQIPEVKKAVTPVPATSFRVEPDSFTLAVMAILKVANADIDARASAGWVKGWN
jgi:hypothetical protein